MAKDMELEEAGFLDEVAGQGFEGMEQGDVTIPRLLISQQLSDVVQAGSVPVGHFYNSLTGEDYGDTIKVIPCHFQKVWVEWKPNQGGYVGTYPVGGLEGVTGDVYSGMKHGENDVIETYTYLLILADHKDAGYFIFQSTRGNLKYLKAWNTAMMYLRTPQGKPAPLFSSIWEMTLNKDQSKSGKQYYSCNTEGKSSVKRVGWVSKDTYTEYIAPARETASQAVLIADQRANVEAIESSSTEAEEGSF